MQSLPEPFGNLQVVPDYDTGFMDLESGAVDAVAMDIVVASYQIESRNADLRSLMSQSRQRNTESALQREMKR